VRQAIIGAVACLLCLAAGPAIAADSGAPDPTSDCKDLRNLSPASRIDACQSLLDSPALTPDQTRVALHGLGVAYAQKGDFTIAIATFTKVLAAYPDDVQDYLSRGATYIVTGKTDLGLADYDKAVALEPKHSYVMRAIAYDRLKKYELALADCEAALKLSPDDDFTKKLRDRIKFHLGSL
jgi:tetratricopeptide (TPR) repeat protein